MKINILFLVSFLISILIQITFTTTKDILDMKEEEFKLIEINESNYSGYIKYSENFFLIIHNSWCKWSQKLEKTVTKINKFLKLESQPYYVGIVDHTIEKIDFLNNFSHKDLDLNNLKYPMLISFKKGQVNSIYTSRINYDSLLLFFKKNIYENKPYYLYNLDSFNYKLKQDKHAFLFFANIDEKLNDNDEESLDDTNTNNNNSKSANALKYKYYTDSSIKCNKAVFYYTNDKEIIKQYNKDSNYTVSYFNKGNQTESINVTDTQDITSSAIFEELCEKKTFNNYFTKFNEDVIEEMFINKKPGLIMFRNRYDNSTEYEETKMQTLSWMNRDMIVGITDIDNNYQLKLARFFGISMNDLPTLRIVDFEGKNNSPRKYTMSKEINTDNMLSFVENWRNGQLNYYFTSSKLAEDQFDSESNVLKIKMSSFYEKVIFNRKNVLVFYYANWCSYCKKYMSVFNLVSKKLNKQLYSFVLVDVSDVDKDNMSIKKVPNVFMYSSSDKEKPIEYTEEITARNIINFAKGIVEPKRDL